MAKTRYVVAKGHSLLTHTNHGRKHLKENTVLDDELVGFLRSGGKHPKTGVNKLEALLRDKQVVRVESGVYVDEDMGDSPDALPGMNSEGKPDPKVAIKPVPAPEPVAATKPQVTVAKLETPKAPGKPVGLWNLDPKGLATKTLPQLNVMVAERDAAMTAFETREEAVAQLSLDFVKGG